MRSNKKYTTQTITKRVDHEAGKHRADEALPEPAVCEICGNVYADRRWTRPGTGVKEGAEAKHPHFRPPHMVTCPACAVEKAGVPSGYLHMDGTFLVGHLEEIERLLRNEADRAAEDNPLGRIMGVEKEDGGKMIVTTTTEHLAQRLGHALEKAYDGDVRYDFSHENKLAHVWWHR